MRHPSGLDIDPVLELVPGQVLDWALEPVPYVHDSPTTGALLRLRGTATSGPWSLFVKVVRSYRHWPLVDVLPPEVREQALAGPAWRYEADVYGGAVASALPAGVRLPRVHGVLDLGDDRLALVLEDVRTGETPWDTERFAAAARALGRLDARLTEHDCLPSSALRTPCAVTELFHSTRVRPVVLPILAEEALWEHPLLAGDRRLRRDLLDLASRLPGLLLGLRDVPQVLGHGDASPQNLLVPAGEPGTFVAVDWTLGGLVAAGDDLGQLLVGLAHAGELDPAALPALHEVLVGAYRAGLAEEGMPVAEDAVRYGLDVGLAVRSAFTALPLHRLHEPVTPELAHLAASRLRLTRYLVDLALATSGAAA